MATGKVLVVVVELKPGETIEAATKEVERLLAVRKVSSGPPVYEDQSNCRDYHWYDED